MVILELHQVINIDTTGLDAIEALHEVLRDEGRHLILAGLTRQPLSLIRRSGFLVELGEKNVVADLKAALAQAQRIVAN